MIFGGIVAVSRSAPDDHSCPRKSIDYSVLSVRRETVPRNLSGRLCATLSRIDWFDHP